MFTCKFYINYIFFKQIQVHAQLLIKFNTILHIEGAKIGDNQLSIYLLDCFVLVRKKQHIIYKLKQLFISWQISQQKTCYSILVRKQQEFSPNIFYIFSNYLQFLLELLSSQIQLMKIEQNIVKYQQDNEQLVHKLISNPEQQGVVKTECKVKTESVIAENQIQESPKIQANFKKDKHVRWTYFEDFIYITFLKQNPHYFQDEFVRRSAQVFIKLSKAMDNIKTPKQCKSHHQKMQKATKGGNIKQIVYYLENKYTTTTLKQRCSKKFKYLTSEICTKYKTQQYELQMELGQYLQLKISLALDSIVQW